MWLSSLVLAWLFLTAMGAAPAPVILVPGTAGSQLQARLDKPSVTHFYCSRHSAWYTIWLDVSQLLPEAINCWCDNIRLLWHNKSQTYTNNVGVYTRTPGWGDTHSIEYLDPGLKAGAYFHDLVEALVTVGGVRNASIRGAPYDFRRAPNSAYDGRWVAKLTGLVEETFAINCNQKVTLVSHSMGCLYVLWFLNQKSQDWKERYIAQWLPTSGVFGGASKGLKTLLSGDSEGVPWVSGLTVREEQRSYESNLLLAPTPQVWGRTPLVTTPSREYTAEEYADLFAAAGFVDGAVRWALVANLTAPLRPPGVRTRHLYGVGVATPTAFRYPSDRDFTATPQVVTGDGDGTVPLRSLRSAGHWARERGRGFTERAFPGVTHAGILQDQQYIAEVVALVGATATGGAQECGGGR